MIGIVFCIFLPAGGDRQVAAGVIRVQGDNGLYRSSTQVNTTDDYFLSFNSGLSNPAATWSGTKGNAQPVRCVRYEIKEEL